MEKTPLVSVCCITYNHAPYISQCVDGFLMQKTSFPFEIIINDDCSNDGTTEILKDYAIKYPDLIHLILHDENQYSKGIRRILATFVYPVAKGKYIALCEGDDYWIDPYKLQKQVDYLEAHPECTLVCNRTKIKSEKDQSFMDDNCCLNNDGVLDAKDVIRKGGLYISTCSLIYRSSLTSFYPEYCKKCHVGDYPLQILAAMKGSVYYLNDPMSVYRVNNPMSWVGRTASKSIKESYLKGTRTEVDMLKGFATEYTNYRSVFFQRIGYYITSVIYNYRNDLQSVKLIKDEYQDDINCFCLLWKLRVFFISHNLCGLRKLYSFFFNCFIKPKFE